MNIIGICVIAVVSSLISVVLKKYNPEYAISISIVTSILIFAIVLSNISPAILQIKSLMNSTKLPSQYAVILFKSLGICLITQFAADSCKDAGENALSSKIELAGKVMIVIISLPLFQEITNTVITLIGGA